MIGGLKSNSIESVQFRNKRIAMYNRMSCGVGGGNNKNTINLSVNGQEDRDILDDKVAIIRSLNGCTYV